MKTPRRIIRTCLIQRLLKNLSLDSFLEVGGGDGSFATNLSNKIPGPNTMIDFSAAAVLTAQRHCCPNLKIEKKDFLKTDYCRQFQLVVAIEVLEHVRKQNLFLQRAHRTLKPKGYLLISVPSGRKLNKYDQMVGHLRKYSRKSLKKIIEQNGFTCLSIIQYGFPLLNLLELIRIASVGPRSSSRQLAQKTKQSYTDSFTRLPNWLNSLINQYTLSPFLLLSLLFNKLNMGNGLICLAQKKAN